MLQILRNRQNLTHQKKCIKFIKRKCEFSDETISDDNNHERTVLNKLTISCEKGLLKYHVAEFCTRPKRNKNYV